MAKKQEVQESKSLQTVTPNDIENLQLAEETKQLLQNIYQQIDNKKPGIEVDMPWSPPIVRIRQALSVSAPDGAPVGALYTDAGEILQQPWKFYILYAHSANMKIGEDEEKRIIVCRSEDGIISNRGIKCAECPDAPFKSKTLTCRKGLEFFVVDSSLQRIYKIIFRKTNYKTGMKLLRQASNSPTLWSNEFQLTTEQATYSTYKYHVLNFSRTGKQLEAKYQPALAFLCQKITEARQKLIEDMHKQSGVVAEVLQSLEHDDAPDVDGI